MKADSFKNRGMFLENIINDSNTYYNSNDKNQLVRVISTDKNGIQQSFLDNKDYTESFSQISNLKEGNERRYLDSNGNCFYRTGIFENGIEAKG